MNLYLTLWFFKTLSRYTRWSLHELHLFNSSFTQISNHPITWQQPSACRHGQDELLKFKASISMMKKGDLRDFKHGTVYRELLEKEKICSEQQFS